jgi:hypothetical protein
MPELVRRAESSSAIPASRKNRIVHRAAMNFKRHTKYIGMLAGVVPFEDLPGTASATAGQMKSEICTELCRVYGMTMNEVREQTADYQTEGGPDRVQAAFEKIAADYDALLS